MRYYKNGNITATPQIEEVILPSHETILANGWFVYIDNHPSFDSNTQRVVRGEVIEGVVQYTVVNLTQEEIQQRIEAQFEAQRQEELPKALLVTSQLVIAERLLDQRLPIERIDEFKAVFDRPVVGRVYKLDWVLVDPTSGELFKVAQPQITYERTWDDFGKFPALFAPFRQPNVIKPWKQPQGAHDAYAIGDRVSHKGFNWESTIPANTTEPQETVFNWWVKV